MIIIILIIILLLIILIIMMMMIITTLVAVSTHQAVRKAQSPYGKMQGKTLKR